MRQAELHDCIARAKSPPIEDWQIKPRLETLQYTPRSFVMTGTAQVKRKWRRCLCFVGVHQISLTLCSCDTEAVQGGVRRHLQQGTAD